MECGTSMSWCGFERLKIPITLRKRKKVNKNFGKVVKSWSSCLKVECDVFKKICFMFLMKISSIVMARCAEVSFVTYQNNKKMPYRWHSPFLFSVDAKVLAITLMLSRSRRRRNHLLFPHLSERGKVSSSELDLY